MKLYTLRNNKGVAHSYHNNKRDAIAELKVFLMLEGSKKGRKRNTVIFNDGTVWAIEESVAR